MRVTEHLTERNGGTAEQRNGETVKVCVCVWVGLKVAGAKSTAQRGNTMELCIEIRDRKERALRLRIWK